MTGICSITMGGEKISLKFGMPACRYFFEHIGQDHITPMSGDSINETGIAYLLYAGYLNHCLISDKEPVKKLEDFFEHVELMIDDPQIQDEFTAVGDCFRQSKSVQKFIEKAEAAADEIKKKLTGMKLNPSATENSDYLQENITG